MQKSRFLTRLTAWWDPYPACRWELADVLLYQSEYLDRVIEVPRGYRTDLASVPRLPFVYLVAGGAANGPAVVHDYLYHAKICSRADADAVFLEAMKVDGEPWWRRRLMWLGVRIGGWASYETFVMEEHDEDHYSRG